MQITKWITAPLFSLALSALTLSTFAAPATQTVIAPQCLITQAGISPRIVASNAAFAMITADKITINALSEAKHQTKNPCGGFTDVTADWQDHQAKPHLTSDAKSFLEAMTIPRKKISAVKKSYSIRYEKEANQLIKQLNPSLMWSNLTKFSSHQDRYADSDDGVAAAKWLGKQVEDIAEKAGLDNVTVYFVETKNYKQPSVVAKFGDSNEPGVVIGAHMDTTSSYFERKPGADDDGSGSMTVLESARTIMSSGMTFKKPIYFVWYSAEEEGLIGSQHVVKDFKKKNIPVDAVMHFDMTGYAHKNEPTIWLIDDNVDDGLTAFLEKIVKTYTLRPVKYTRCGYACSDHASWSHAGYKAVIPAEARYEDTNPTMHSSADTIDNLSITHMTDYAKIATAFAVELAEPTAS